MEHAIDRGEILTVMRPRGYPVAFALIAMLFLSMRPACEVFGASNNVAHAVLAASLGHSSADQAPHGDGASSTCCSSIEDRALVKLSEPWAQAPAGGKLDGVPAVFALSLESVLRQAAARPFRSDPRSLPYHARSARIQR